MPLYNLACRNALDHASREKVAQAITKTHCDLTGAPPEFVNVVFLHGYPLDRGLELNVIGGVRKGGNRGPKQIEQLRRALEASIAEAAGKTKQQVAVSLIGLPVGWVMEGGRVMPEPGAEDEWLKR